MRGRTQRGAAATAEWAIRSLFARVAALSRGRLGRPLGSEERWTPGTPAARPEECGRGAGQAADLPCQEVLPRGGPSVRAEDLRLAGPDEQDVVLAASEAAANAILHGGGQSVTVSCRPEGAWLAIEVENQGTFDGRPVTIELEVTCGRGPADHPGPGGRVVDPDGEPGPSHDARPDAQALGGRVGPGRVARAARLAAGLRAARRVSVPSDAGPRLIRTTPGRRAA
jgi:hypothetical protein